MCGEGITSSVFRNRSGVHAHPIVWAPRIISSLAIVTIIILGSILLQNEINKSMFGKGFLPEVIQNVNNGIKYCGYIFGASLGVAFFCDCVHGIKQRNVDDATFEMFKSVLGLGGIFLQETERNDKER